MNRWLGCALLAASPLVAAETLPDPTRPPLEVSTPAAAEAQAADSGLQSVIIAPGRRAAIINGQTVELGEKYGDARLVEVNERGVVLRGPEGKQELTLFPGVEIKRKVIQPAAQSVVAKPAAAGKAAKKKAAPDVAPQEGK